MDPDIPVAEDPGVLARGVDQQLDAGIKEVERQLQSRPVAGPKRPPYQNRTAGAASAGGAGEQTRQ